MSKREAWSQGGDGGFGAETTQDGDRPQMASSDVLSKRRIIAPKRRLLGSQQRSRQPLESMPNPFANINNTPFGSADPSANGTAPAQSVFGQPQTQQTAFQVPQQNGSSSFGFTFGSSQGSTTANNPFANFNKNPSFGSNTSQPSSTSSTFSFGAPQNQPTNQQLSQSLSSSMFTKPAQQPSNGVFGQQPATTASSNGSFGQQQSSQSTAHSGLFGTSSSQSTTGSNLFGQQTSNATTSTNLFGQPSSQVSFGKPPASNETTAADQTSAEAKLTDSEMPKRKANGAEVPAATPSNPFTSLTPFSGAQGTDKTRTTSLFGQAQTTPAPSTSQEPSKSIFGTTPSTPLASSAQPQTHTSLFGSSSQSQNPTGLFGTPAVQNKPSTTLFGTPATQQQGSIFGTPAATEKAKKDAEPKQSLFTTTPSAAAPEQKKDEPPTTASEAPKPAKNPFALGTLNSSSSGNSLFGNKQTGNASTLFGASDATKSPLPSLFGASNKNPGPSLFGNPPAPGQTPGTSTLFGTSTGASTESRAATTNNPFAIATPSSDDNVPNPLNSARSALSAAPPLSEEPEKAELASKEPPKEQSSQLTQSKIFSTPNPRSQSLFSSDKPLFTAPPAFGKNGSSGAPTSSQADPFALFGQPKKHTDAPATQESPTPAKSLFGQPAQPAASQSITSSGMSLFNQKPLSQDAVPVATSPDNSQEAQSSANVREPLPATLKPEYAEAWYKAYSEKRIPDAPDYLTDAEKASFNRVIKLRKLNCEFAKVISQLDDCYSWADYAHIYLAEHQTIMGEEATKPQLPSTVALVNATNQRVGGKRSREDEPEADSPKRSRTSGFFTSNAMDGAPQKRSHEDSADEEPPKRLRSSQAPEGVGRSPLKRSQPADDIGWGSAKRTRSSQPTDAPATPQPKTLFGGSTTPGTSKTSQLFSSVLNSTQKKDSASTNGDHSSGNGNSNSETPAAANGSIFGNPTTSTPTNNIFGHLSTPNTAPVKASASTPLNPFAGLSTPKTAAPETSGKSLFERISKPATSSNSLFDRITKPSNAQQLNGISGNSSAVTSSREESPAIRETDSEGPKDTDDEVPPQVVSNGMTDLSEEERKASDVLYEQEDVKYKNFSAEKKNWVGYGQGPFRILKDKASGSVRILVRQTPSGKVLINTQLIAGAKSEQPRPGTLKLTAVTADGKLSTWLAIFSPKDTSTKALEVLQANEPK